MARHLGLCTAVSIHQKQPGAVHISPQADRSLQGAMHEAVCSTRQACLTDCILSVCTQSGCAHPCLQCSGSSLRLADSRCFSSVSPLAIIMAARVTAAVPYADRNTAYAIRCSWLFLSVIPYCNQRVKTQDRSTCSPSSMPAATPMCHARQAAPDAVNRSRREAGKDTAGHTGMQAAYADMFSTHLCPWPDQLCDVALVVLKLCEVVASRQRPAGGL